MGASYSESPSVGRQPRTRALDGRPSLRHSPSPRVAAWLDKSEPFRALPRVVLAGPRYGMTRLRIGHRRSSLLRFRDMIRDCFLGRIFSFGERAIEVCGDMTAAAERAGTFLNAADGRIAAIAPVRGTDVATRPPTAPDSIGCEALAEHQAPR